MDDTIQPHINVGRILQILDSLAPPDLAEPWDKVGLQIGDPEREVSRVLVTLDLFDSKDNDIITSGCQLIICHHPPVFHPISSIRTDIPEQRMFIRLIEQGVSLIAAHTNLDAAPGGVADSLADALGLDSKSCRSIATYGRLRQLDDAGSLSLLLQRVRIRLGSCGCRINTDQDRPVRVLAAFPGSFDETWIPDLVSAGADTIICGEIRHHIALMLAARGIAVIDTGHDVSERVVLEPLARKLKACLPQISFAVCGGLDYNKIAF